MMEDYISREAALTALQDSDLFNTTERQLRAIRELPAADVAPVVHGQWIDAYPDIEPNPMFMYGICSECGFEQGISKYLNYCPNCGAKMDGVVGSVAD